MRRRLVRIGVALVVAVTGVGLTISYAGATPEKDLAAVRRATVQFHDVQVAQDNGYAKLLDCFDSPTGGMGQHYVQGIDNTVDALHPEALVYEVGANGLHLVAVEWIVPDSAEVRANVPEVLGQRFHLNESLGVWVLHAWIWRANPTGMFKDWNPNVKACKASS
jgi:hypothetical protein